MVRPTKEKAKLQHYLGEERRRYLESIRSDWRSCPATGHIHPDDKEACSDCNGKVCKRMHAKGLDDAGKPLLPAERPTCGAKTRAGGACAQKVIPGKTRCRFHGGKSTGPRTSEGRARIAAAQRKRWAKLRRGEGEG
jgi:hypothetical protein